MNGEDIPFLNGYPLRLIVPGYYGTYWVKHLSDITVLDKPFDGFWMSTGYRIPDNGSGFIYYLIIAVYITDIPSSRCYGYPNDFMVYFGICGLFFFLGQRSDNDRSRDISCSFIILSAGIYQVHAFWL